MDRALRALTLWNLCLPLVFAGIIAAVFAFDLDIGGGAPMDGVAFVVAWGWVITTPIAGMGGLVLSWRQRSRWLLLFHLVALVLWSSLFFLVMLTPSFVERPVPY